MINRNQECYLIITPSNDLYRIKGPWPDDFIKRIMSDFNDIIVVSLYSNTVKFIHVASEEEGGYEVIKEASFDREYEKL